MAEVFLSYSRHSERAARALINDLEALGHAVWVDQELTGGQVWWDQILAHIRACELFVFVLDSHSIESTACSREYNYAAALGRPILPVLVTDGVSMNLLPPALSQIQHVDYREADRNAGFRLARAVATVPAPPPLPEPLPAPPPVPISYLGGIAARLEAAGALSYEDQSALVVDLRRGMRDPETKADATALVRRLRVRRDLFAAIGEEIDELVAAGGNIGTPSRVPAKPAAVSRSDPGPAIREDATQRSLVDHPASAPRILTPADRFKGAALLAILGLLATTLDLAYVVMISHGEASLYLTMFAWYAYPTGGAIAGVIWGTDRADLLAGAAGVAAALGINVAMGNKEIVLTLGPLAAASLPALAVIVAKMRQYL